MVLGMIYGTLLYKKKVTFIRCIIAEILVVLIVDIILNTFFLSLLYGKAFALLLPARAFKNVVMIPINASMMYFILKLVNRIKEQNF